MNANQATDESLDTGSAPSLRRYVGIAALLLIITFAMWTAVSIVTGNQELAEELRRIEAEHGPVLELIEARATELQTDDNGWPESLDRRNAIEAEIAGKLGDPRIVSAHWSLDGHHRLDSFKSMTVRGFSISPLSKASNASGRRTLRFGESFDGKQLLVLEGRVPEGVKRVYEIAFLATE